ncbi:hypothetical protein B0H14DRAFT_2594499 [Mycena olivaceomarginata]|nr:hypothetical protein B0H14DRAFT_2594499 [Mycena olivaceomarginata]
MVPPLFRSAWKKENQYGLRSNWSLVDLVLQGIIQGLVCAVLGRRSNTPRVHYESLKLLPEGKVGFLKSLTEDVPDLRDSMLLFALEYNRDSENLRNDKEVFFFHAIDLHRGDSIETSGERRIGGFETHTEFNGMLRIHPHNLKFGEENTPESTGIRRMAADGGIQWSSVYNLCDQRRSLIANGNAISSMISGGLDGNPMNSDIWRWAPVYTDVCPSNVIRGLRAILGRKNWVLAEMFCEEAKKWFSMGCGPIWTILRILLIAGVLIQEAFDLIEEVYFLGVVIHMRSIRTRGVRSRNDSSNPWEVEF